MSITTGTLAALFASKRPPVFLLSERNKCFH
jgi:hypothetical protein